MVEEKNTKSLIKLISTSTIIASMCCLPSVVLVLFGLASVSTAAALSDTLYWGGEGYDWFRLHCFEQSLDSGNNWYVLTEQMLLLD